MLYVGHPHGGPVHPLGTPLAPHEVMSNNDIFYLIFSSPENNNSAISNKQKTIIDTEHWVDLM